MNSSVSKLKRSELEAACKDFSNVIGSSSLCSLYKGTLSSGVDIAVESIAVASTKDLSSSPKSQFRKKIATLSKVNHKNFVCLLGYCVEEDPFTRMMVFEHAPNETLFEHLHKNKASKETEKSFAFFIQGFKEGRTSANPNPSCVLLIRKNTYHISRSEECLILKQVKEHNIDRINTQQGNSVRQRSQYDDTQCF